MTDVLASTPKAGRVGPHRKSSEPRLDATLFLAPGVTPMAGYLEWDGSSGITDWGMDYNDRWGCCGFAGLDHINVAKSGNVALIGQFAAPKFATLINAYWQYGLDQGEVGQPPNTPDEPDQGVDNATVLAWAFKNGLIYGYGQVPLDHLDWYAQTGRAVLVGLTVDGQLASQCFEAVPRQPWDAMPDAQDGHDTAVVVTHADGSGALVTWGGLQPYTLAFRETNFQDAWIIYDEADPLVDHDALQAALADVHGIIAPPVEPVQPGTDNSTALPAAADGLLHKIKADVDEALHEVTRQRLLEDLHRIAGMAIQNEAGNLIAAELQALVKRFL